jgi:mono/diheme cytochrome c family protein
MVRLAALTLAILTTGAAYAETPVERGAYLVNTIMSCANCHTPKGPTGDIADKAFSGGMHFNTPAFDVTAANITQDKDTGIGTWTDDDIKKLLRTGVRPNGVPLAPIMPTGFYGIVTDSDMDAIVAYVRTIPAVNNAVTPPIYKIKAAAQIFPGAEQRYTEAMMSDELKKGIYLSTIGHCLECHTPMTKGHRDFANDSGKGGMDFPGPWGVSISRNITSSKTKGIGDWTDADIKRALTQGVDKDGNKLKPPMGYPYYAHMTDADLNAVIAWVRTLPPIE